MSYKLQTNFFGGDTTFIKDFLEFETYNEAVDYVLNNQPPDEFEWNIRENGEGSAMVWTCYSGEEVMSYSNGKIVKLR